MKPQRLFDLAKSGMLVPGIYNYCDQWCAYCAMTARCLAFRALQESEQESAKEGRPDPLADVAGILDFTRAVAEAEGAATAGLDEVEASAAAGQAIRPAMDDPLERLARAYAHDASRFLHTAGWVPMLDQPPARQPAPIDVVAWYHVLIAAKIFRALHSAALAADGEPGLEPDATGSAKVALIGIGRSIAALRRLAQAGAAGSIGGLLGTLGDLERAVDARFPDARTFARPGLDAPVV